MDIRKQITNPTSREVTEVRELWKEVFGDSGEFLNLYFDLLYKKKHTLVLRADGRIAASLQQLPYWYRYNGKNYASVYIYAVMTHPDYRKRGYMEALMEESLERLQKEEVSLVFLIPQEAYLFDVYAKYGFKRAFPRSYQRASLVKRSINSNKPVDAGIKECYAFYRKTSLLRNGIVLSAVQFEFLVKSTEQEGGACFCIGKEGQIAAMAFVVPVAGHLLVIDVFAAREADKRQLLYLLSQQYGNDDVRIACYEGEQTPRYGMGLLLDKTIKWDAVADSHVSLMMDI